MNLTVHQIYKSNADKMNIFLDFRNIYHVSLDHISLVLQLLKASCEFIVCSIFLKIPVLTKVSVYLKPKCYIQNFHNLVYISSLHFLIIRLLLTNTLHSILHLSILQAFGCNRVRLWASGNA